MNKKIYLLLSFFVYLSCNFLNAQTTRVNKIDAFINSFTIREIANTTNQLITPRDLDFHPNGELWAVNQVTEQLGGSTVTIYNPGKANQVTLFRKDPNSWHFMSLPSGIAFSNNNNFATSTSVFDANHNGGQPFTGPALWSSDSAIYAQNLFGPLGSHLDMLHESPHCMGIASEKDNIFWVMDAYNKDIVRYDFKADHGPGNDDHADGEILRYKGMTVNWINQDISSHLELDDNKKWLYIVDGGNKRVLRLDITTGIQSGTPTFGPFEPLALYSNVINATWEVVADTGLVQPVGIDIIEDRMIVSDHSDGNIYIYDISSMPATRIGTIATGEAGIQGIVIGPEGNIWYVNSQKNTLSVAETFALNIKDPQKNLSQINIFPNPTSGVVTINGLKEDATITVTDISGKIVMAGDIIQNNSIDLNNLQNGIYFLNIKTAIELQVKKIILSK